MRDWLIFRGRVSNTKVRGPMARLFTGTDCRGLQREHFFIAHRPAEDEQCVDAAAELAVLAIQLPIRAMQARLLPARW